MCIYRRGVGSYDVFMEVLEEILDFVYMHFFKFDVIITGDFNINLFENSDKAKRFLDLLIIPSKQYLRQLELQENHPRLLIIFL